MARRGWFDARDVVPAQGSEWRQELNAACAAFAESHTLAQMVEERKNARDHAKEHRDLAVVAVKERDHEAAFQHRADAFQSDFYADCLTVRIAHEQGQGNQTVPTPPPPAPWQNQQMGRIFSKANGR